MATKYPNAIDTNNEIPLSTDNVTPVNSLVVNTLRGAILAIETELGVDPSREYGSVRARLDALVAELNAITDGSGSPTGPVGGDLAGTLPNPSVIDLSIAGQQQGSILFFNGTNWVQLTPGSDGKVLTTHNSGSDPTWTLPAAGINLTNIAPEDITKSTALVGVATSAARSDHKHNAATATAVSVGAVNTEGSSISLARADHTHKIIDLAISSQTTGDILYFNGTNWIRLGVGNDGYVLTVNGGSPTWKLPATGGPSAIAAGTQSGSSGAISFINSNGISFGMSGSNQITASYTVPSIPAQTSLNHSNANNVSFGIIGSTLTASASFPTATAFVFSNANNISFGTNGSTVTASANVPSATSLNYSNANGISFGVAGSTLTASYTVPTVPAQTSLNFSNANNVTFGIAGSTVTASVPTQTSLNHSNANGISFGIVGSTLTASYTVPSTAGHISGINISAGTTSNNLSALTFSNSNGLSFGINGSVITGSYTVPNVPAQTSLSFSNTNNVSFGIAGSTVTASVPTQTSLNYSNSNGISFGIAGSTLTASYSVPTQTAYQFSNSNGISFGTNGSTITASYSVPTQSIQTQANIQGISVAGSLIQTGTIVFSNSNGISFGFNGQTMTMTVQPGAAAGLAAAEAGTQVATSGTLNFVNSNGISFGLSGSSQLTAIYTVPSTAGLISSINVSAGTTSNNLTNFVFSNSNGLTFGLNGSTITGSYTVPTQTSLSYSNANNVTFGIAGSTLTASVPNQTAALFSNSNGISFGTNLGTVTASYTVPSTAGLISALNFSAGTTSGNLTAITFSNSNGLSFGLNGSVITGSYTVPGVPAQTVQTQGVVVPSAGTQTATSGTVSFVNSNGISFGMSGSNQITASYTVPNVLAQTNQTVGLYALGNTTQNSSTTFDARSLSFNGLGAATVGYSNGSIQVSVPNQSAQTQSNIQGISAGTQLAQTGNAIFSNSNGISFGMSNSSVITASYTVPSTAGLISAFNISAGTTSNNLSAIIFSNSNGLSFGLNGSTITGSYTAPTQTSLSYSNANNITFGIAGSTLTASVASQTAQTQSNVQGISAGTQLGQTGNIIFSNSNGITFGMSNNSIITASYTVPSTAGHISGINISAGTTSNNLTNFVFSNSNNISFGLSGSTITGSFSVPSTTDLISGTGIVSISTSVNTIFIGAPVQSVNISAGTASNNLTNFVFSNSNGLSFGLNGSTITGSYTVPTQTSLSFSNANNVTFGIAGSTLTASVPTQTSLNYSNSNGLTFGIAGSTLTGSYTVPSTTNAITGFNISAGTTSNNMKSVTFSNSNGMSFGLNGSVITGSYTVPSTTGLISGINVSAGTTSNNLSNFIFSNANGVSFGLNGSTITGSIGAGIAGINISAAGSSINLTNLVFSNSNNLSFGLNGSTITGSSPLRISAGTSSGNYTGISFMSNTNVGITNNLGSISFKATPKASEVSNDSAIAGATVDLALNTLQLEFQSIGTQSSSFTLLNTSINQLILITGTGVNVTVPPTSTGHFIIGSRFDFILRVLGASVGFAAGAGVTIFNTSYVPLALGTRIRLECVATDLWVSYTLNSTSADLADSSNWGGLTIQQSFNSIYAQATGSLNGVSISIIPLFGTSGWYGGINDDYIGEGNSGSLGIALTLYPNVSLRKISVWIEPALGHSALPGTGSKPFLQLYISSPFTHSSANIQQVSVDSSPNLTAYETKHSIDMTLSTPLNTGIDGGCWIRIVDELVSSGSGLRLKKIILIYS